MQLVVALAILVALIALATQIDLGSSGTSSEGAAASRTITESPPSTTTAPTTTSTTTVPTTTTLPPPPTEPQPASPPSDRPPAIATDVYDNWYKADPDKVGKYTVEVYAINRGEGTISIDFGAFGLPDLPRPETSCLVGRVTVEHVYPAAVELTMDEPGRFMGTISFTHRYVTGWDFLYHCSIAYDGVPI